jgi:hypothetical protein
MSCVFEVNLQVVLGTPPFVPFFIYLSLQCSSIPFLNEFTDLHILWTVQVSSFPSINGNYRV